MFFWYLTFEPFLTYRLWVCQVCCKFPMSSLWHENPQCIWSLTAHWQQSPQEQIPSKIALSYSDILKNQQQIWILECIFSRFFSSNVQRHFNFTFNCGVTLVAREIPFSSCCAVKQVLCCSYKIETWFLISSTSIELESDKRVCLSVCVSQKI